MKKVLISVVASLCCFAAAMSAFAGCGPNNDSGADKTDELQTKIEQLQTQITELQEELNSSKSQAGELKTELDELKEYVSQIYIEGEVLSLAEAYEQELLTRDNLIDIAYYYRGRVNNEEIIPEDYVPTAKNPESVGFLENSIKRAYLDSRFNSGKDNNMINIEICEYYGIYGDCIAFMISDCYMHPGVMGGMTVADVTFCISRGYDILIWRKIK